MSRTSSRTSKNLSLSSSNRSFEDLRKLTIECILVCTSFKVTILVCASFKVTMSLKNIVLSIHIPQAFPLKHYSIGGKGSKRISITQVKFHHHGDWWGEEEESVIDLGILIPLWFHVLAREIFYAYLLFWWWWWTSTILIEFNLLYMSNLVLLCNQQSKVCEVISDVVATPEKPSNFHILESVAAVKCLQPLGQNLQLR